MSLNLHSIVRGPINAVNSDEDCFLIQAGEQKNVLGKPVVSYNDAEHVKAQIQSLGDEDLQIVNNDTLRTPIDRKFYLFADTATGNAPKGIVRPLGKAGDFIYRVHDKSFWKIYNVSEDFSPSGWVSVLANMQVQVPDEVKSKIENLNT